jgi:Flp pilus assembly pilin Flp
VVRFILSFWSEEKEGQDLAEYCLLIALVALVGLAIFVHVSGGVQAIWGTANTTIVAGNSPDPGTGGRSDSH